MELKKCVFCAEDVKNEAIVCKYCGRNLMVKKLSPRQKQWIYANNMIGSIVGFALLFGIVFAAIAEFTGIGGGFAPLADPFTPIRNEIAKGWAALGVVVGFAVGVVHGSITARQKLARIQGEEIHYC